MERLFPDERRVVGLVVQVNEAPEQGWHLNILVRREGQSYLNCRQEDYEGLSAAELLDVVDIVVAQSLGIV